MVRLRFISDLATPRSHDTVMNLPVINGPLCGEGVLCGQGQIEDVTPSKKTWRHRVGVLGIRSVSTGEAVAAAGVDCSDFAVYDLDGEGGESLADEDGGGEVPLFEGGRMGVEGGGGGLGQFGRCCSWDGACAGSSWLEADVVTLRLPATWMNVGRFQGHGRQQVQFNAGIGRNSHLDR